MRILVVITAKAVVAAAALLLFSGSEPASSQTPVKPLDGRPTAVPAAGGTGASTTITVTGNAGALRTLATRIPVRLPPEIIDRTSGKPTLKLGTSQSFVIDPAAGEWYSFVDQKTGYTLSVEGDNRLLTNATCEKPAERNSFLGTTSTIAKTITDRESGPKKEILIVADCVPYRAVLECDSDERCDKLKKQLPNTYMSNLVALDELVIPADGAARSLTSAAASGRAKSEPRPVGSSSEFTYLPPGLTLVRQYAQPTACDQPAKGAQFTVDRRTPYSRLVFAGPDLVKRFPVVLNKDQRAVANSQIFGPGGGFLATPTGQGRSSKCDHTPSDHTMGSFGDEDAYDARNFSMPWADTFCEWRGNSYTQPFCAAYGAHAMEGPHFGVDVRSWNSDMSTDVPIVSSTDGVVVEVNSQAAPGGKTWKGFVVKVRSQHLIFVYRHMNPDKSPFRDGTPNGLRLGDSVAAGQVLGYMGKFYGGPNGTTKHLHFEIEAPVPKSVLLGPACVSTIRVNGELQQVRVCTAREKAPAFPTLIVAYLADRYGERVGLSALDKETGLPVLPVLPHELKDMPPPTNRISSR